MCSSTTSGIQRNSLVDVRLSPQSSFTEKPAEENQRAPSRLDLAGNPGDPLQLAVPPLGSTLPIRPLGDPVPEKGPLYRALKSLAGNTLAEYSSVPEWATEGMCRCQNPSCRVRER